jgi:hypothetical protein
MPWGAGRPVGWAGRLGRSAGPIGGADRRGRWAAPVGWAGRLGRSARAPATSHPALAPGQPERVHWPSPCPQATQTVAHRLCRDLLRPAGRLERIGAQREMRGQSG